MTQSNQPPGHPFTRPGQVRAELPAPDRCMTCGEPEASHDMRGRVVADRGGWVSGPCLAPGDTPHGMLFRAVIAALDVPPPAGARDELTYFRTVRDRAAVVRQVITRLADDREADGLDVLMAARRIGEGAADYPADGYDAHPLGT